LAKPKTVDIQCTRRQTVHFDPSAYQYLPGPQGGFSEALMACLRLAPVSLFWGRDFVKLLALRAWVLSAPLLCLDQAIDQVESGAS
jgi:hypothetical protein